MSIEIIEQATVAKLPDRPNEDGLAVTADFVAVFDGMSDPVGNGDVAGATAALVDGVLALPAEATAREAVDALTRCRAGHGGGAVGVLYSRARRELWRVGDVHWALDGEIHLGGKLVDDAMTRFRAAVNWSALAGGTSLEEIRSDDPGLRATFPLLRAQGALANTSGPWGYGVFDGTPVPDEHLEITALPAGATLVLATDGYLSPAPTLAEAEAELRAAVDADPVCLGLLAAMGKAMQDGANGPDDRTYVRLIVG